jgi:transcriptional regulator with XRE-family HTH domain
MTETKPHIGRNITSLRELCKMKQETLAEKLGVSQQAVSRMEQNESVDDSTLEKVAKVLGITPDAIKNFNAAATMYYIQNNYEGSSHNGPNYNCTFNPLDKLIDIVEENKKLTSVLVTQMEEIKKLNTALLKEKDEKIAMLQKLPGEKGK